MKMKKRFGSLLAVLVILGSCAMLFYPFISNYLFEHRTDSLIGTYEEEIENMESDTLEEMREQAKLYNTVLSEGHVQLSDPFKVESDVVSSESYQKMLNSGTGIMSYIDIPKIDVYLPVYHGTSSEVLEQGIGHLEGSSLPVGGESTHCVLSGHTGLNRAKLFTDLTELEEGDNFYIHTLGETLAYEVDQITVVDPADVSNLEIEKGEDYVTLLTCTPYGVNSHRLLVRGTRVPYEPDQESEDSADSSTPATTKKTTSRWMLEYEKALVAGISIVILIAIIGFVYQKRCKRRKKS